MTLLALSYSFGYFVSATRKEMIQLHGWPPIYKIKKMIIYLVKEHIVTPVSGSSGDDVKDRTQYHTGQELQ